MAIDDNTVYGLTGAQIKELPGKIEAVKGLARDLTEDDYDWPTDNPARVALWKLPSGIYTHSQANIAISNSSNAGWDQYLIIINSSNSINTDILLFNHNELLFVDKVIKSNGHSYGRRSFLESTDITDNLTSTSTTTALSAAQGKALKDLIDAIQVPTKTSDLTNDSNFVTSTEMTTALADKADTNDIPTALSELTNDINAVSDANYVHTDNNYTTAEKNKLAGIAAGAEVNVQANWAETDTTADSYIQNKPTIPAAQIQSDWNQASTVALDYIKNKPVLATVATSGSYSDLTDKPTIPVVHNATLTIQQNGTTVGTFTANSSAATTVDIETPAVFTTNEWNALWA